MIDRLGLDSSRHCAGTSSGEILSRALPSFEPGISGGGRKR